MATAVVIDSDGTTSSVIQTLLGPQHRIISYAKGSMADEFVRETAPDVVFLSMSLPDVSPIELLEQISLRTTGPPVVALMEAPRPPGITNAVRHGACEVLAQPLQAADLQASLLRALSDRRGLFPRTGEIPAPEIVGMSAGIVRLRQLIMRIAPSKAPVLIEGESGVGKELVAEAIHKLSQRAGGPFEARNCGAFPTRAGGRC